MSVIRSQWQGGGQGKAFSSTAQSWRQVGWGLCALAVGVFVWTAVRIAQDLVIHEPEATSIRSAYLPEHKPTASPTDEASLVTAVGGFHLRASLIPAAVKAPPPAPPPPPPPEPNFELVATLVSGPHDARAFVRQAGKMLTLRVGDKVDGFEVASIEQGAMVVKANGLARTLRVEHQP